MKKGIKKLSATLIIVLVIGLISVGLSGCFRTSNKTKVVLFDPITNAEYTGGSDFPKVFSAEDLKDGVRIRYKIINKKTERILTDDDLVNESVKSIEDSVFITLRNEDTEAVVERPVYWPADIGNYLLSVEFQSTNNSSVANGLYRNSAFSLRFSVI